MDTGAVIPLVFNLGADDLSPSSPQLQSYTTITAKRTTPMRLVAFALVAVIAGGTAAWAMVKRPPAEPITIFDVGVYLTQNRCPDGSPPYSCWTPAPQKASDPMFWRRMDWPAPGWQISESVATDGVAAEKYFITTWAYGPGPFNAARGDGGEIFVSDGTKVRIAATQDGGTPGIQRFALWGLFDNKVHGSWRDIDILARARRDTVTFPASGYGLSQITADTIVSEHYDVPGYGGKMERFHLAAGWGRLAWAVFGPAGSRTPPPDLAQRCPAGAITQPPDVRPDWVLYDCRVTTRLVPADGSMSVADFGWPPVGFVP